MWNHFLQNNCGACCLVHFQKSQNYKMSKNGKAGSFLKFNSEILRDIDRNTKFVSATDGGSWREAVYYLLYYRYVFIFFTFFY